MYMAYPCDTLLVLTVYLLKYITSQSFWADIKTQSIIFIVVVTGGLPNSHCLSVLPTEHWFVEAAMCQPRAGVTMDLNPSWVSSSAAHGGPTRDEEPILVWEWEMRGSLLQASGRTSLLRKWGCAWEESSFCFYSIASCITDLSVEDAA